MKQNLRQPYDFNVVKSYTKKPEISLMTYRKENGFYKQISVIDNKTKKELITVRYYATSTRVYCCVWIFLTEQNIYLHAGGYAGGYGYHKQSAALEDALHKLGFVFAAGFGGCGDSAEIHALEAILKHFKVRKSSYFIHEAHA